MTQKTMTHKTIRLPDELISRVESLMAEKEWSFSKAVNHIVRYYFEPSLPTKSRTKK